MVIVLRGEALKYYILASLNIEDLFGFQILQMVASYLIINESEFYDALTELEYEGKITKEFVKENDFIKYNLFHITPMGKDYMEFLLEELNSRR